MTDIAVRPVDPKELDHCVAVIGTSFATVAKEFGLTRENCPTNPAFIRLEHVCAERDRGCEQYGLFAGEQMAGFVALERGGEGVYQIKHLAVLPEYRHQGFGKLLLDYVKDKAASYGAKKIEIGIIEENAILKRWYGQNGFVSTGTQKFAHLPFTVGYMEWAIGD